MKQKEEHLLVGDMAEQPKPIEEQANPSVAIPQETVKMANAVLATGPIIMLYPFIQKYFISGITVGAVKG